jgi:hypothetical protein
MQPKPVAFSSELQLPGFTCCCARGCRHRGQAAHAPTRVWYCTMAVCSDCGKLSSEVVHALKAASVGAKMVTPLWPQYCDVMEDLLTTFTNDVSPADTRPSMRQLPVGRMTGAAGGGVGGFGGLGGGTGGGFGGASGTSGPPSNGSRLNAPVVLLGGGISSVVSSFDDVGSRENSTVFLISVSSTAPGAA